MIPPTSFAECPARRSRWPDLWWASRLALNLKLNLPINRGIMIEIKTEALRERQALLHAGDHGFVDQAGLAELALALRTLARGEVAQAGFAAEQLASSGHFK